MPADFKTEYRLRTDEELLQFWVERSELLPEAEASLRHEIARRSLTERAAMAQDRRIEDGSIDPERTEESGHRLARPVSAWGPTIAWYWLRELRMRHRTKGGIPLQAKVESTMLTRPLQGRGGGGRRAELCYSYDYQGPRTGRTVRDFLVGDKVGKALAFGHRRGDTITVLVDPNKPDYSYFPSGFGWIQPLLYGLFFSLLALVLLGSAVALAFSFIMNQRQ
jgi:Protein of unknown function (DUF3592)